MAPKNKNDGGSTSWRSEDEKEKVQAVVIADSFNRKFTPITQETPRALLPLGNKVLIDYTIEYLMNAGVNEIIVFCCAFGERIREYVNNNWKPDKNFTINCVLSSVTECISLGDALREIDREGLIRSDFLLVPGDLMCNIQIENILEHHKVQRKKEKNLVMTMLYRELAPGHFSRCKEEDAFIAMDSDTHQIVQYQKSHACTSFDLSNNVWMNGRDVDIHYNLSFTHVALCSPQVAPLFTDNFDYQTLDDFVKGVLINEDIMGDKINGAVIREGYSCRVNDLHMYNAISLDLLGRWTYPITVDNTSCPLGRNNVYIHNDVIVEKDCTLKTKVLVGKGTTIGEKTHITQSTIGANCKIGKNVTITNSYIWDNTVIGDDCYIVQSIICENCQINRNVKMVDAMISYNVCIDEGMELKPCTRLSLKKPDSDGFGDDDDDDSDIDENMKKLKIQDKKDYDIEIVGANGKGFLWPYDMEEEGNIPSLTGNDYETSDGESNSEDEDEDSTPNSPQPELSNLHQFHIEVVENLKSGYLEKIAADNIALEINASKFKFNISILELCQTVAKALLEMCLKHDDTPKTEQVKEFGKVIKGLHPLLLKYFNTAETQTYAINSIEEHFLTSIEEVAYYVLPSILHKLYDADVLDEAVILRWYACPHEISDDHIIIREENRTLLRKTPNLLKFVNWLQEAEEEDDSDEEEDE